MVLPGFCGGLGGVCLVVDALCVLFGYRVIFVCIWMLGFLFVCFGGFWGLGFVSCWFCFVGVLVVVWEGGLLLVLLFGFLLGFYEISGVFFVLVVCLFVMDLFV